MYSNLQNIEYYQILSVNDIKHMRKIAPDYFPQTQQELDISFLYLLNDSLYVWLRRLRDYPDIAEVSIHSDPNKKSSLSTGYFDFVLNLAKCNGFKDIAVFIKNKRLKNIYLKKKKNNWLTPWGNGWFLNRKAI